MKNNSKDNAGIRIPPLCFFFGCLGSGFLLEYLFPIHKISIPLLPRIVVGCIFIFISGCIAVSALTVFIKNKTPFDPGKSTVKIVKEGPYRFSRNPLYLSLLLLLAGIAVLNLSFWLLFTIPILYILFLFNAVLPEERYLLQKFGKEYSDYSEKVRRWI